MQVGTVQHLTVAGAARHGFDGAAGPPRQLPMSVPDFTGRTEHIVALDDLIPADGDNGNVPDAVVIWAVDGVAGIGKTTLAVHWAHRVQHRFPDGVLHINLHGYGPGTPVTAGEALDGFLRALEVPPERIPADLEARSALFRSVLADRRVLVVLDNAYSADQVRPLLPGAPGCMVVVTSRDSLTGLVVTESARRLTLDLLTEHEAQELVAGIIGPDRVAAEPQAVVDLIRLCGRLPLALRIAAGRAAIHQSRNVAAVVAELTDDQARLDVLSRGADERTSVRSVLDWSYRRLSAEHARLFRQLGLHPGPDINPDAAAALVERDPINVHRLLEDLAETHLIESTEDGRYRFHDLLRVYAADQARRHDSTTERDHALISLLTWYTHAAIACDTLIFPAHHRIPRQVVQPAHPVKLGDRAHAFAWARMEQDNLFFLFRHAADNELHDHVILLAQGMRFLEDVPSRRDDKTEILDSALVAAQQCGDEIAEVWVRLNRAAIFIVRRQWGPAQADLDSALALNHHLADNAIGAGILNDLGWLHGRQGRFQDAKSLLLQALPLSQGIDSGRLEAVVEGNLSEVCVGLGDYHQALGHARRSLALRRQCGDLTGEANALHDLAAAWQGLGEHEHAITFARNALSLGRTASNDVTRVVAAPLDTLAISLHQTGHSAEAVNYWQEAAQISEDYGDPHQAAQIREHLRAAQAGL
jgi:tetratricopeptide (TPR) repeat protein